MPTKSKAQQRATQRYEQKNYDKVLLRMKKGERELITTKANEAGMSLNRFIMEATYKYMGIERES